MKTRLTAIAALAVSSAFSLPSFAGISTGKLALDVQSAVGGDGRVSVTLEGDVATLSGNVDNSRVARDAVEAALQYDEIGEVIDLTHEG